jgi:hypothetical protein
MSHLVIVSTTQHLRASRITDVAEYASLRFALPVALSFFDPRSKKGAMKNKASAHSAGL